MAIIALFGLPGAGKSHLGEMAHRVLGVSFYDADDDLSDEMLEAMRRGKTPTNKLRDRYFERILGRLARDQAQRDIVIVAQVFPRDADRITLARAFPATTFVLVQCDQSVRERRIEARRHHVPKEYARSVQTFFEAPTVPFVAFDNTLEGDSSVVPRLTSIIRPSQARTK